MTITTKKRRTDVDIIKVVGLLCIILAHTNPPSVLFQFRNFDVVLMIMVSTYLGIKSYNNIKIKN